MPGFYSVAFDQVTFVSANPSDMLVLKPVADHPLDLLGFTITTASTVSDDFGDAGEEYIRIAVQRGATTTGNASAVTPQPMNTTVAALFTAGFNGTTPATGAGLITLWNEAFNVRTGLDRFWPVGSQPAANSSQVTMVIKMTQGPLDALPLSISALVYEK